MGEAFEWRIRWWANLTTEEDQLLVDVVADVFGSISETGRKWAAGTGWLGGGLTEEMEITEFECQMVKRIGRKIPTEVTFTWVDQAPTSKHEVAWSRKCRECQERVVMVGGKCPECGEQYG